MAQRRGHRYFGSRHDTAFPSIISIDSASIILIALNVRWGDFFEDTETSLPLAKREAGRQLLLRLRPGDHLFGRFGRAFGSVREATVYLEDWLNGGSRFICSTSRAAQALITSTAEGSTLLLQTLAAIADFKRALAC